MTQSMAGSICWFSISDDLLDLPPQHATRGIDFLDRQSSRFDDPFFASRHRPAERVEDSNAIGRAGFGHARDSSEIKKWSRRYCNRTL